MHFKLTAQNPRTNSTETRKFTANNYNELYNTTKQLFHLQDKFVLKQNNLPIKTYNFHLLQMSAAAAATTNSNEKEKSSLNNETIKITLHQIINNNNENDFIDDITLRAQAAEKTLVNYYNTTINPQLNTLKSYLNNTLPNQLDSFKREVVELWVITEPQRLATQQALLKNAQSTLDFTAEVVHSVGVFVGDVVSRDNGKFMNNFRDGVSFNSVFNAFDGLVNDITDSLILDDDCKSCDVSDTNNDTTTTTTSNSSSSSSSSNEESYLDKSSPSPPVVEVVADINKQDMESFSSDLFVEETETTTTSNSSSSSSNEEPYFLDESSPSPPVVEVVADINKQEMESFEETESQQNSVQQQNGSNEGERLGDEESKMVFNAPAENDNITNSPIVADEKSVYFDTSQSVIETPRFEDIKLSETTSSLSSSSSCESESESDGEDCYEDDRSTSTCDLVSQISSDSDFDFIHSEDIL